MLQLTYVDELLAAVQAQFVQGHYRPQLRKYPEFEDEFRRLLAEAERKADGAKQRPKQAAAFDASKRSAGKEKAKGDADTNVGGALSSGLGAGAGAGTADGDGDGGAFDMSKLKAKLKKPVSTVPSPAKEAEAKKKKACLRAAPTPPRRAPVLRESDALLRGLSRGGRGTARLPEGNSTLATS